MSEEKVTIAKAKGRPMLTWVGKRPLSHVTAFPAQHVETFDPAGDLGRKPNQPEIWADWPAAYPKCGLLFHGDNKDVLAHLLASGFRGKVRLVYIDPPFDSGADYVRQVSLRGKKGLTKIDAEGYSLGEQVQYSDIWANDNYLQFMFERLLLLKELLSSDGSIYLHCDWHRSHLLRLLLDEVFGPDGFRSQVVREKCNPKNYTNATFGNIHDILIVYSKSDSPVWNRLYDERSADDVANDFPKVNPSGRRYKTAPLHAPGIRAGETGQPWRGIAAPPGNHWRYVHRTLDQLDNDGLIEWSDNGNPRKIVFAENSSGYAVQDIWMGMKDTAGEYPTEKNPRLLARVISASSNEGDVVLDCFVGSGTTAGVAQALNRRWIACDVNKGAVQQTSRLLQSVIADQEGKSVTAAAAKAVELPGLESTSQARPPSSGFTVWRVNDYDLAIQHNEAVNLACEHVGVERSRSDAYFDGTRGRSLVKVIPFGHPLSPPDLEELKRELEARPDEDRPITVVCLGMELAAAGWVEDWNRLRKAKDSHNRIEVIELRSDPKYGRFIKHEPATARVKVECVAGNIIVVVEDFISPTIIERLKEQAGVLAPKVEDWRAMVDCVMIDTSYDGQVFNVRLSDIPEKKADLVAGRYELPAPEGDTTVAVKLIDMLGEEVLGTWHIPGR
jgi:adenine-specific DNA-methyltransferase